MPLPHAAHYQLTPDMQINRLLNGMWQVSGAHGAIDPDAALEAMLDFHHDGFYTWDLADHYGPAEDFIGTFRQRLRDSVGDHAPAQIQAFTKWVPRPGAMTRGVVSSAIQTSLRRMKVDSLDLLQFHWWRYDHPAYLDAMKHLADLQAAGQIKHLGLTNFDTEHTRKIAEAGTALVSNQVQYSIIDRRPEVAMVPYCLQANIALLTYGTLCGGLLSERYLEKPEPAAHELRTASLRKYKQMIDLWGGWRLFQQLLRVLRSIAEKHNATLANIATRYILDKPAVGGVIVGVRLGVSHHRKENAQVFNIALDEDDYASIHAITDQSRNLYKIIGDCGDEYRR